MLAATAAQIGKMTESRYVGACSQLGRHGTHLCQLVQAAHLHVGLRQCRAAQPPLASAQVDVQQAGGARSLEVGGDHLQGWGRGWGWGAAREHNKNWVAKQVPASLQAFGYVPVQFPPVQ